MKLFKLAAIFFTTAIFFAACQKEIVFSTNGLSVGTLKENTTGNCLPSTVNGIYQKDSTITSDNFIDVNVDVTSIGTYSIQTDTVNGVSFKGTGTFGLKGNNVVRLYGHGKPTAIGISTFTVTYGTSICTIDVTVIGSGGGNAIYTIGTGSGCSGFTLGAGTYNAGQILVAGNTVTLNVSVLAVGSYNLTTDTVNNIWFNASGVFTNATVQSLTLHGNNTPASNGTYNYHLSNGSTSCTFSITFGPGSGGTEAAYKFGGDPSNCTGVTPHGVYKQGVNASGNTLDVQVTVSSLGSYNIRTTNNNGISFSASGTFTTLGGPQTVTLNASGTPTNQGAQAYTVQGITGTATVITKCDFSLTFDPATAPSTNLEYIPMTTGSNWSTMIQGGTPADTTYMEVSPNNITLTSTSGSTSGTYSYRIFEIKDMNVPTDSLYFRKVSPGKYYQYSKDDFGVLDNPYLLDFLVLDSNKVANDTWSYSLGANTAYGGLFVVTNAHLDAKILEKGAVKTVALNTYTNVYRVFYTYTADVVGLGTITIAEEERWYAKGYGLIYDNIVEKYPTTTAPVIINTTRTQIN